MIDADQWRQLHRHTVVEWSMFALGVLLIIARPAGRRRFPGPGGIFCRAPALALILKTSMWAKRRYVRVKRWQPKAGRWMDWALRRPSAQRREAIRKASRSSRRSGELTCARASPLSARTTAAASWAALFL